ncbi:hypothetical protein DL93DRAFT_407318 [Clavulina sp. PMI_390]|nr:hypothetical protein DL93DRAFT_407318 [Clavulina sp. PMI_390]
MSSEGMLQSSQRRSPGTAEHVSMVDDGMTLAYVDVEPFPRPFLPELEAEFLSYLPLWDLKSCSLASRSLHHEAIPLLWHSIKFQIESIDHEALMEAREHQYYRFSSFITFLATHTPWTKHARSLTIELDELELLLSMGNPLSHFLSVPLDHVERTFSTLSQLTFFHIVGPNAPADFISCLSRAFSSLRLETVITEVIAPTFYPAYSSWSSITELIALWDPDQSEVTAPTLPNLRFVASQNLYLITAFLSSSPLESIYLWGEPVPIYDLEIIELALVKALRKRQNSAQAVFLHSARLCMNVNAHTEPGYLLRALGCPTMEHIELNMDCLPRGMESPHLLDEHPILALERPPLWGSLRNLKSLKFHVYDQNAQQSCSVSVDEEVHSVGSKVDIVSPAPLGATFRLARSLQKEPFPSLERVEIHCMGKGTNDSSSLSDTHIEASRVPLDPNLLLPHFAHDGSDKIWKIQDSRLERGKESWYTTIAPWLEPNPLEGGSCENDRNHWRYRLLYASVHPLVLYGNLISFTLNRWWEMVKHKESIWW